MLQIPEAGKLQHRQAMRLRDRAQPVDFFRPRLHPTRRAKSSMITRRKLMTGRRRREKDHHNRPRG